MTFDRSFDHFAQAVLLPDFSAQLVGRFRKIAKPATVDRHRCTKLDDAEDHFVFVASGATKLVAQGISGGEQVLSFQFEGDFTCIPGIAPHAYYLIAIRKAALLMFRTRDVIALAGEHPQVFALLATRTLGTLQRCRQQLVTVGRRSATERVAGFLMSISKEKQVATDGGHSLRLLMTRREIADNLGLTVETVSRQFSVLRQRNLIETPSRNTVKALDWAQLAQCAGHLPQHK